MTYPLAGQFGWWETQVLAWILLGICMYSKNTVEIRNVRLKTGSGSTSREGFLNPNEVGSG
jgi:hypothetical protein